MTQNQQPQGSVKKPASADTKTAPQEKRTDQDSEHKTGANGTGGVGGTGGSSL